MSGASTDDSEPPGSLGLGAALDLSSDFALERARVEEFRAKGHTVVRGLASRLEVDAYRPAISEATATHAWEKRPLEERDTYGKAFLQAANLWRRDATVRRFTLARRFAKVAAELLEVDAVRLYHDQALFKEAGGGRTPWHQDQHYWPLDTDRTITMWMPLVDVPPSIGTMTFVSGSHRLGYLGEYAISDESDAAFDRMIVERGLTTETHGAASAGDATFHSGWMLHSAPPNPTGTLRAVMTVIYYADGTRIVDPVGKGQEFDLHAWLRGCRPGDLAATDRNPVVYSSSAGD
jgi:ectoine hydroxylase-related dioxygenase (phytanoyl-CoA dioxygenase family)